MTMYNLSTYLSIILLTKVCGPIWAHDNEQHCPEHVSMRVDWLGWSLGTAL